MSRTRKPIPRNFNSPSTCKGKRCYATRTEAEVVIEERLAMEPNLELTIYSCMECHTYHLTRSKPTPI